MLAVLAVLTLLTVRSSARGGDLDPDNPSVHGGAGRGPGPGRARRPGDRRTRRRASSAGRRSTGTRRCWSPRPRISGGAPPRTCRGTVSMPQRWCSRHRGRRCSGPSGSCRGRRGRRCPDGGGLRRPAPGRAGRRCRPLGRLPRSRLVPGRGLLPRRVGRQGCGGRGAGGTHRRRRRDVRRRGDRRAHQRAGATTPTTPPWRCGCSARASGWSGTSRTAATWRPAMPRSGPSCPQVWFRRSGSWAPPSWRPCCGVDAASVRWSSRRCRSWSRRSSPRQGRGRLYRRVRDREHAASILRAAARRRLAVRVRLPVTTDPRTLVLSLTQVTGRSPRGGGRPAVVPSRARRPGADPTGRRPGRTGGRGTPLMTQT